MNEKKIMDVVLDTDTDNEMDDQFALVFAALFPEKLNPRAFLAAPFHNERSSGPGDGSLKSYREILKWLDLLGMDSSMAFRGSSGYLPHRREPVDSPAARRIIELAKESSGNGRILNILAIAALTNVASALLLDPSIARHVRVIWLGGHSRDRKDNREFNLIQDIPAVQAVLESGCEVIRIPCIHGADVLTMTLEELQVRCLPCGRVGSALYELALRFMKPGSVRIIWDISTVAYLLLPEAFTIETSPFPSLAPDGTWLESCESSGAGTYREVKTIRRNAVFDLFFRGLADFSRVKILASPNKR